MSDNSTLVLELRGLIARWESDIQHGRTFITDDEYSAPNAYQAGYCDTLEATVSDLKELLEKHFSK